MGNVTSSLIEHAIKSSDSDIGSLTPGSLTTYSESSKQELYRLLHGTMDNTTESCQKNVAAAGDSDGSIVAQSAPKECAMLAPKKKFLIGYRGDETGDEKAAVGSPAVEIPPDAVGNPGAVNPGADVAKVFPASSAAEVARSRSHTVSLPFRNRGPPPHSEALRRPLVETKGVGAVAVVSSAVTIRSYIMTAIDSRVGGTGTPSNSMSASQDSRPKPIPSAVDLAGPPFPHQTLVSQDPRPAIPGSEIDRNRCPTLGAKTGTSPVHFQQQQKLPTATHSQHYQYHHRVGPAGTESGGGGRQMPQLVTREHRPAAAPETVARISADPAVRHAPLQGLDSGRYDRSYVVAHSGVDRAVPVDRRFVPAGRMGDNSPPQMVDRRFSAPVEYWRDASGAEERRKVGYPTPEVRQSVRHDSYMAQVQSRHAEYPHTAVSERGFTGSHFLPTDTRSMLQEQTAGSYPSWSVADMSRGWVGQHLQTDSYRQGTGVVEFPSRDIRSGHYDMGEISQHGRKYPSNEARMSSAEYAAAPDLQYGRHHLREPITAQSELDHDPQRQIPPCPGQLQPVEPTVRPRIAGLTHGDAVPAPYDQSSPQVDVSRYSAEHAYRSSRYDLVDRRRPISDTSAQFISPEQKQACHHSPYYSTPGAVWASTSGSGVGLGSSSGSSSVPRVALESPLDLTVRKEQSMTAEAFLRRCHDSTQHASQYVSPVGRHGATDLQYSSLQQHHWAPTRTDAFEPSVDVRRQMVVPPPESLYPGHAVHRTAAESMSSYPGHQRTSGDAVRPIYSAVRDYHPHTEADVRSLQYQRRPDEDDVQMVYPRRDPVDPRWDSAHRHPVSSITVSPVRPGYWDGRGGTRPSAEILEGNGRSQRSGGSYVGEVGWTAADRAQYASRLAKSDTPSVGMDHRPPEVIPLAVSPQSGPSSSRRVPMVQLLGGKYSPSDILHLCCKVCGSTYGSLRSFRMHFAKSHGQEPTPENFTIQTISDARIQAMSQHSHESPPTFEVEPSMPAPATAGRDVMVSATSLSRDVLVSTDADQHKRNVEFSSSTSKPRSVAEVQPMQKKLSPKVQEPAVAPPTPASKITSPEEAIKRSGEERKMKCKKCGQFSSQDLSVFRQHVRSHAGGTSPHSLGAKSDTSPYMERSPTLGSNSSILPHVERCPTLGAKTGTSPHALGANTGTSTPRWMGSGCDCGANDTVDADVGCAVCLEGFNDVRDWQHHVTANHATSQHMMRSCVCKSCDLGFTNSVALRRHLAACHGAESATSRDVSLL